MKTYLFPAIRLTFVFLVLCSIIYTAIIWGVAKITPNNGEPAIINVQGKRMYSDVGQKFDADQYFWSRPSAVNYNAAAAGASNKGPYNTDYLKSIQANIDSFVIHHPDVAVKNIPIDMITASASGLDPDITVQAANIQVNRIAHVRNLQPGLLQSLIQQHIHHPFLGIFGPAYVNVLELNVALNDLSASYHAQ
ncbi:potassium-transporting ATPase subunit C [Hydrotalea sandarakina]|jgi:K+-transporting ATPase ATPase C chain|uniref:Potassium-transporting ATPase KdpC subunit n=1 Tax=Hydrotalea sandarakina TaxID=1004304 RepID=A0A2W7SRQ6_9BACT|nr:potassium-transporting ATPase subunit C [Hydrotalea sandarakina]PZX65715.1 K+-transporting ATPase ATPase C chain [Hydrotalea sandarakina]